MDDHHHSISAYDRVVRGRALGAALVLALLAATAVLLFMASEGWRSRFERVFEPLPGLLYAPPVEDLSLTTADNPVPLTFQTIDRSDAYRYNASIPVSGEPLEPAPPFVLPSALSAIERNRAVNCLTQVIYYEAGSESAAGQRAVAQVVLNRMRHPAFPSSVCGVVYSGSLRATGCQFTFTCDGSLGRPPSTAGWARARSVALAALSGAVDPTVGQATHYHALYVAPYWSPSLLKVANIGAHTFYRWKGFNGKRAAFVSPYAGREPAVRGRLSPVETMEEAIPQDVEPTEATPTVVMVAPSPQPEPSTNALAPTTQPAPPAPPAVEATPASKAPAAAATGTEPTAAAAERPRRRVARADW